MTRVNAVLNRICDSRDWHMHTCVYTHIHVAHCNASNATRREIFVIRVSGTLNAAGYANGNECRNGTARRMLETLLSWHQTQRNCRLHAHYISPSYGTSEEFQKLQHVSDRARGNSRFVGRILLGDLSRVFTMMHAKACRQRFHSSDWKRAFDARNTYVRPMTLRNYPARYIARYIS